MTNRTPGDGNGPAVGAADGDSRAAQVLSRAAAFRHFATFQGPTQSQQHIKPLHDYVTTRLVLGGGFAPDELCPHPPLHVIRKRGTDHLVYAPDRATNAEATILGGLKTKNVDVVVTKEGIGPVLAISCKSRAPVALFGRPTRRPFSWTRSRRWTTRLAQTLEARPRTCRHAVRCGTALVAGSAPAAGVEIDIGRMPLPSASKRYACIMSAVLAAVLTTFTARDAPGEGLGRIGIG